MNSGIKLVIYGDDKDIEILDKNSDNDVDLFIKLLLENFNIKNTNNVMELYNELIHDMSNITVNASLHFYNNDVDIGCCGMECFLDDVYSEIEYALDNLNESVTFEPCIGCYIKDSKIRLVDFDFNEAYYTLYNECLPCSNHIEYDCIYNDMSNNYGSKYVEFERDHFISHLLNVVNNYENFINNILRAKLVSICPEYGNELADLIYDKSNWKGNI